MTSSSSLASCPRCQSNAHVREKLLLIDSFNDQHFKYYPNERSGCSCQGDLSVDGLKPEFVREGSLQQFVTGLYCELCGVGFVPEDMAKPKPKTWKVTKEGYCRVNPDGSLGPPQQTMQ